ncbi:MAG: homocysteine S-methyltransferase family protein [candidate division WOR-3 bacterium]
MEKANRLRDLLAQRVVFLDGATGTELMKRGLPPGVSPELWASEHPDAMRAIHRAYLEAGADVILTNTFGANRAKLGGHELVQKINGLMVQLALSETGDKAIVAASIGPTGLLIYPEGPLRFSEAYEIYREQAEALFKAGIDVFFLETFMDIRELRAAAIAVRDVCPHGFISVQMTFDQGGLSLTGTSPAALALLAEQLAVDAVGVNCSLGPEGVLPIVQEIARYTGKFIVAEPNAGLPVNGRYPMGPEEFSGWAEDLAWAGANIIGGCCGTTPEHIREFVRLIGHRPPQKREISCICALTSLDRVAVLGKGTLAVGESLNPTGRPSLQKAIREGDADPVISLARAQERADAIDVNLGLERMIPEGFVREVFSRLSSGPPVLVDLSEPDLIREAFENLAGISVLNSLTATERDISEKIGIPLRYGGFAVLLPIDEEGLGETTPERIAKIRRGIRILEEHNFPVWRVIADPAVRPVGTGSDPTITLKTLEELKRIGLLTIAGVSNISHGLPARQGVNSAMLSALVQRGLDLAIIDVCSPVVMETLAGARVLFQGWETAETFHEHLKVSGDPADELFSGILAGDKRLVRERAQELLKMGVDAKDIIKRCLSPAMERIGQLYEQKKAFLPHLVRSAEAAEALMAELESHIRASETETRGTVVIATVRGDVHDIGKNLVALFLRNSGFRVIDLGRDVPAERIVQSAIDEKADIIALSALMSTTAPRMEEVIKLVKDRVIPVKVMVGGAVVTEDFARAIGADGYGKDAYEAVRVAQSLVQS